MLALTSTIETPFHRWPAAFKLGGLAVFTVTLMSLDAPVLICGALALVIGLYCTGGLRFLRAGVLALRPLWPFVLVLVIWHLVIGESGRGAVLVIRMLTAVAMANLVTLTTRLDDMIHVLQVFLSPLARFGLSADVLALAIGLVVRFTAVFVEKAARLRDAWRARSPRRPGWALLLPLFTTALDDADHVSDAIRARSNSPDK